MCPECKQDQTLQPYMGLQFGKYKCKNCDYIGPISLEREKPQNSENSTARKREQNRRFFDRWAQSYDHFIFGWWMRYIQREVIRQLDLTENSSVLDVGCGTGFTLLELSAFVKKGKLRGIDLSTAMIRQAKKKLSGIMNAAVVQAEVEKIPFPNNSFDYVISTEAFHHFPHPQKALEEMKLVVRKSGIIIIADISFPPHSLFNLLFKLEPGFVKMYSKREITPLAKKTGLRVVEQKRRGAVALIHILQKNDATPKKLN